MGVLLLLIPGGWAGASTAQETQTETPEVDRRAEVEELSRALSGDELTPREKIRSLAFRGRALHELGDFAAARDDFEAVLRSDSLSDATRRSITFNLAIVLYQLDELQAAADLVSPLIGGDERSLRMMRALLIGYREQEDYAREVHWGERLLEAQGEQPERRDMERLAIAYMWAVGQRWGRVYSSENQAMGARGLEIYDQLTARWPDDVELWRDRRYAAWWFHEEEIAHEVLADMNDAGFSLELDELLDLAANLSHHHRYQDAAEVVAGAFGMSNDGSTARAVADALAAAIDEGRLERSDRNLALLSDMQIHSGQAELAVENSRAVAYTRNGLLDWLRAAQTAHAAGDTGGAVEAMQRALDGSGNIGRREALEFAAARHGESTTPPGALTRFFRPLEHYPIWDQAEGLASCGRRVASMIRIARMTQDPDAETGLYSIRIADDCADEFDRFGRSHDGRVDLQGAQPAYEQRCHDCNGMMRAMRYRMCTHDAADIRTAIQNGEDVEADWEAGLIHSCGNWFDEHGVERDWRDWDEPDYELSGG